MPDRYNFRCFRSATRRAIAELEPLETMRHPITKALNAYWEQIRAGRLAPDRSDVAPAEVSDLLPCAFILERVGEGEVRFRLAGDGVSGLVGMTLNGMSVLSIWDDASRMRISQLIEGVVSAPATAIVNSRARRRGNIEGAVVEFSFLPLRSEGGDINRILGSAVALTGESIWRGDTPRLFKMTDMHLTAIQSDIEDQTDAPIYAEAPAPGVAAMAESAAPFELKAIDGKFAHEERPRIDTPDRGRGHLRVVKDGE